MTRSTLPPPGNPTTTRTGAASMFRNKAFFATEGGSLIMFLSGLWGWASEAVPSAAANAVTVTAPTPAQGIAGGFMIALSGLLVQLAKFYFKNQHDARELLAREHDKDRQAREARHNFANNIQVLTIKNALLEKEVETLTAKLREYGSLPPKPIVAVLDPATNVLPPEPRPQS